jgi:hypothetical protein
VPEIKTSPSLKRRQSGILARKMMQRATFSCF